MNTSEFTVISSNITKNNSFCNKLQAKDEQSAATVFGTATSVRQNTVYLFTDKQNAVGTKGMLDLNQFDIVTKPFTIPNGDDAGTVVDLKYLYPKS